MLTLAKVFKTFWKKTPTVSDKNTEFPPTTFKWCKNAQNGYHFHASPDNNKCKTKLFGKIKTFKVIPDSYTWFRA